MPRKNDDNQTDCLRCKLPIYGVERKFAVRLSTGMMHGTCHKEHAAHVAGMIAAALAAGTHSLTTTHVCQICRDVVPFIYHATFDGKAACEACARAMGVKFSTPAQGVPAHV